MSILSRSDSPVQRRLPVGAEVQPAGGVHFRVWAPAVKSVAIAIAGEPPHPLTAEPAGYFSGFVAKAGDGTRYACHLDSHDKALPDPASRFQPNGPHGVSQVVDPSRFAWSDANWQGVPREQLVIYEMHIGSFTPEGTWAAAAEHLTELLELGITAVELMPVADFPGDFGWGYDGVDLFAPTRLYGSPDDLRRFIDRAHGLGLAVLLDVVYNHFGPDGNYLRSFAPAYFSQRHGTEWGDAINFDGPDSGPVREFFLANAGYWIEEYHFDGLRLDATHRIYDTSGDHILAAIGRRVRLAAAGRATFIAAENDDRAARIARPLDSGGYGLDGLWNDDFHHAARVALTGRREFYYRDFTGCAREFVALAKYGYLFESRDGTGAGSTAFDLPAASFVNYLENHDQIAHSGAGLRGHLLSSPGCWRAMTTYLMLSPGVPLLFQGQEFSAPNPFLYFAHHEGELGQLVKKGRAEYLANFSSLASPEMQARLDDPASPKTFRRCVLDHSKRQCNEQSLALHRDLIALRREVLGGGPRRIDGAVLGNDAWVLRYSGDHGSGDLLLIVNLGVDQRQGTIAEPLLAPVDERGWRLRWSSEHPDYGGTGIPEPVTDGVWQIPGHAAIVLAT